MDVLQIALIVLVVAGIWAIAELALTIRKTRSAVKDLSTQVGEVTASANDAIEQVQPIVQKLDGIVTDIEPAVKELKPLVDKTNTALDMATVDLASVNDILVDVTSVTDTASNVTSTVSKAANSAVSGVAGVVGKFTGGKKEPRRHRIAEKVQSIRQSEESVEVPEQVDEEPVDAPKTYFTYGSHKKGE